MNNKPIFDLDTIRACILGHAVGDALGLPVEFRDREELDRDPVTDMRAYGTFEMPRGTWSDDTSMTLCALDALAKEEFSWDDVMKNFVSWLDHGEYTPAGNTFDVGNTCRCAIRRYERSRDTLGSGRDGVCDNGNGSLMRIIPFALYAPGNVEFIETASALTHAHKRSRIACVIYALVLEALIQERRRSAVQDALLRARELYAEEPEWQYYEPLLTVIGRHRDTISGKGYVVSTLEAALWSLLTTENYSECVLRAVNLGLDTDTVAAVAGGLAGALYGLDGIPEAWLNALKRRDYLESFCVRAAERWARM